MFTEKNPAADELSVLIVIFLDHDKRRTAACSIQTGEFLAHLMENAGLSGNNSNGWHYFFIVSENLQHEAFPVYPGNSTVDSMGLGHILLLLGSSEAFVANAGCCSRYAGIDNLPQICYCGTANKHLTQLFRECCGLVTTGLTGLVLQDRQSFCNFLSTTS
ncbi:MAG: hypothetical protein QM781_18580 [Chitinophagaceae bacterium]